MLPYRSPYHYSRIGDRPFLSFKDVHRSIRAKFTKSDYERTLVDPLAFYKWMLGEPLKLSPGQRAALSAMATFPETLVIGGAKGGKSTLSSNAALWMVYRLLCMKDPVKHYGLVPGTHIYVMNIAPKEDLALNIVLNYIRGYAESSWYLSRFIETHKSNELVFVDDIICRAQGSSSRAGLGYAMFGIILDEVCHFMDTKGNMAGSVVYNNYTPRMLPFGTDGRLFAISTPAGRQGVGYDLFCKGVPQEPYILQRMPTHGEHPFRAVFQMPTWVMNPQFPRTHPFLLQRFKADPFFCEMEFGAMFADVVAAFFRLKQLEMCKQYIPFPDRDLSQNYFITHDPSVRRDAYAVVLGHQQADGKIRVDLTRTFLPNPDKDLPVDVKEVKDYIINLCERYSVVDVVADETRAAAITNDLLSEGVPARGLRFGSKSDIRFYQPLLEAVNTQGISFPPNEDLLNELRFLERVQMTDRYRVQAAPGNTDDLADCIAMLTWLIRVEQAQGGGTLLT